MIYEQACQQAVAQDRMSARSDLCGLAQKITTSTSLPAGAMHAVDFNGRTIDSLEAAVNALAEKLAPILRPDRLNQAEQKDGVQPPETSDLVARIGDNTKALSTIAMKLRRLTERVEL